MTNRHSFFTLLTAVLFFCGSYRAQTVLDRHYLSQVEYQKLQYLPNGKFLKSAALSFDEILADLLWIQTLHYFGEHAELDQNYPWLAHLLDITTTLDPYFQDPYEFGGIILSWEMNDVDAGIKIMQKGMDNVPQHHPRYWYLPFFTAFNYMYHKQDYQTAAHYLEIAASFPQRPPYLPLLVARLYANTDDPGVAIPFLEEMLTRTDSPRVQKSLQKRIKIIRVKQHIKLLTTASEQFLERTGRDPNHLRELTDTGILETLPVEPFGGQYQITKNGTIESTSNPESMEIYGNTKKENTAPLIFIREPK